VIEPLELDFTVRCAPAHAFETFARRTSLWWPKAHSFSGDPDLEVVLEPRVGGRIYERTPAGDERDWGEITGWDEPRRLSYFWHLGTERSRATHVSIEFEPDGLEATIVRIVHSGWESLGADAESWRERNKGGWAGVLDPYQAACEAS
jgi:uncharacterized protein YndB with AHSA1/START domain